MLKKTLLLVILAAIIACYFIFNLGQYLNLEYLQTQKDQIATAYQQNQVLFLVVFFLIYVISVAVSIPGATILTLTAGFLFQFWYFFCKVSPNRTLAKIIAKVAPMEDAKDTKIVPVKLPKRKPAVRVRMVAPGMDTVKKKTTKNKT